MIHSKEKTSLINWAKSHLPDPESYPANYIALPHFESKTRYLFKKRKAMFDGRIIWKWEYKEKLPIIYHKRKADQFLY